MCGVKGSVGDDAVIEEDKNDALGREEPLVSDSANSMATENCLIEIFPGPIADFMAEGKAGRSLTRKVSLVLGELPSYARMCNSKGYDAQRFIEDVGSVVDSQGTVALASRSATNAALWHINFKTSNQLNIERELFVLIDDVEGVEPSDSSWSDEFHSVTTFVVMGFGKESSRASRRAKGRWNMPTRLEKSRMARHGRYPGGSNVISGFQPLPWDIADLCISKSVWIEIINRHTQPMELICDLNPDESLTSAIAAQETRRKFVCPLECNQYPPSLVDSIKVLPS